VLLLSRLSLSLSRVSRPAFVVRSAAGVQCSVVSFSANQLTGKKSPNYSRRITLERALCAPHKGESPEWWRNGSFFADDMLFLEMFNKIEP
jgi:hypothetical protein